MYGKIKTRGALNTPASRFLKAALNQLSKIIAWLLVAVVVAYEMHII